MTWPPAIEECRLATADGAMLYDARSLPQAGPELFVPPAAGVDAERPRAGRGAVWFVGTAAGPAVLRHYRRGGLPARLLRDSYLWLGEPRNRAFREFRLLAELRRLGLPVPAPLAARYQRLGLGYRADLLVTRIAAANTLAEQLDERLADDDGMALLGRTLARFHAVGVCHADLNAHNLLRDGEGGWWLIDFDRGQLRTPAPGWIDARLARLQRSLRKLGAQRSPAWPQAWRTLLDAHRRALSA